MAYFENGIFHNDSNTLKLDFETILKLLPFIPVALTLLSLSEEILFYYFFDIKIVDYLELNEALISSLDLIVNFFVFLILSLFGSYIVSKIFDKNYKIKKWNIYILLITVYLLISYYLKEPDRFIKMFSLDKKDGDFNVPQGFLSFFIEKSLLATTLFIFLGWKFFSRLIMKSNSAVILILSIFFILFTIYLKSSSFDRINAGYYCGTIIRLSDTTIISDKNNLYVGKTQKFIFLYNKEEEKPTAFDIKNLKSISFETDFCKEK